MRVIADTSPLIALERIGQLDLLQQLYRTIWIPPAVRREMLQGSQRIQRPHPLRHARWIRTARQPLYLSSRLLHTTLGAGESEVLALAARFPSSLVLIDEVAARTVARAIGLRYTGTLGVLLKAKAQGLIPAVRPLLDELIRCAFHLSTPLYRDTLTLAGESVALLR